MGVPTANTAAADKAAQTARLSLYGLCVIGGSLNPAQPWVAALLLAGKGPIKIQQNELLP